MKYVSIHYDIECTASRDIQGGMQLSKNANEINRDEKRVGKKESLTRNRVIKLSWAIWMLLFSGFFREFQVLMAITNW